MDFINEYLDDQGKFTIYQCSYCEKEVNSLGDLERHCYNNGHDHRDITLNRIEANATAAISKASAELNHEIEKAIQGKKTEELTKQI